MGLHAVKFCFFLLSANFAKSLLHARLMTEDRGKMMNQSPLSCPQGSQPHGKDRQVENDYITATMKVTGVPVMGPLSSKARVRLIYLKILLQ
jgi:hypothetical protein